MSEKPLPTSARGFKEIALTTCTLMVFCSTSAKAEDARLVETSNNIQKIYQRIQQKYAAINAQNAADSQQTRQESDTPTQEQRNLSDANTANLVAKTEPTAENSRFAEGEELILTTSANNIELASIFATKSAKGLRVDFADFVQILEFPIYINNDQQSAEGWFLSEKNRFLMQRLNDGRLMVEAKNRRYYISEGDYEVQDSFLIEISDIANWFDLDFKLNEEKLALNILSKTPFPFEARLARLGNKTANQQPNSRSVMPLKDSSYKAFSPPMLDVQVSAQQTEQITEAPTSNPNATPTKYQQSSGSYSMLASHDLAYFNSTLFLSGNTDDALNTAWLNLSRESDASDLLGPLAATKYEFGDVVPINAGFGNTLGLGRGFSLANTPIDQLADNRKVNISGPIQEGWDVELYRNGILIDQRLSITEGRYDFNDIPLDYGNNDFQLIFYGPQGQMETKTESFIADSNTVNKGEGMYRFSLIEVGESVFNSNHYTEDPSQQGLMASTILDYGITDWLALSAGGSTFTPRIGETQQFFNLGVNANLGKAGLLGASFLQDQNDLSSLDLNYRTRLWNTSYSINARRSENAADSSLEKSYTDQYTANMSGQLFSGTSLPLSYQNLWRKINDNNDENRNSELFQNALSIGGRFGYLTNSLSWFDGPIIDTTLPTDSLENTKQVFGNLLYRKNLGRLNARLFSSYSIKPTNELTGYGGSLNYNFSNNFNTEFRYSYFTTSDLYQMNLGLNWRKDAFYLSGNAGYNENGSWSAGLTLRFSLGYEPIDHKIFTSGRAIAQSGAVAVRVFEDLNMNGNFDENERPIENATVKAVQAYRQDKTNDQGIAVLSSLYNNTTTDIVVDESTLDGPFMITAIPGVAIKARKGYVDTVNLPVVKAGELEGVIYFNNENEASEPAPYISLNLIDKNNKVVATTRSEFDGYYLFTNVKPGNYDVKVDENYVERKELKPAKKEVGFSSNGDIISGFDFVLKPLDEAHGYVANAGHFDSPNLLKLYYQILRRKMGNNFIQTPFYIKQPNKAGYILGIAYFPSEPVAGSEAEKNTQEACAALEQHSVYCEVQYHDFKY